MFSDCRAYTLEERDLGVTPTPQLPVDYARSHLLGGAIRGEWPEACGARGVLKTLYRLHLDLPNALSGNAVKGARLFKSARVTAKAKPELDYFSLSRG
jgi:hypothetical protein